MNVPQLLRCLGQGLSIEQACAEAGLDPAQFHEVWQAELRRRLPDPTAERRGGVRAEVEILRDARGVPHLYAQNEQDLFFAFGYAMAQDRLFQLDYLRRKASGRLAEVLGPEAVESDVLARTLGLRRVATAHWRAMAPAHKLRLTSFSAGVNAQMQESQDCLPIEFALLDYQPEPWSAVDSLAIQGEFRWYLTGRFPVICIPELARRALHDERLWRAFLTAEADEESILPPGSYRASGRPPEAVGETVSDVEEGVGSNNWVVHGRLTQSGLPLLASDPHIAISAVSVWYEAHLHGGPFHVAGMTWVGMPAILAGRNEQVAWGITNNICSQRDLYQERENPARPGEYLYDGRWEPAAVREETIQVRGLAAVHKQIVSTRNGPLVDELLPGPARATGPVSLRWLGAYPCGWLEALWGMNLARNCAELRAATESWRVPTFCIVAADVHGDIAYQCTGRIPLRQQAERGYRPGWDPAHQWQGLIPFADLPALDNPAQGFVVTANNRTAPADYHAPLAGTWSSGHRARRARELLESAPGPLQLADMQRIQHDVRSLRAVEALPPLMQALGEAQAPAARELREMLQGWNGELTTDSRAASAFSAFFSKWCDEVAAERFEDDFRPLASGACAGLALQLISGDTCGWFHRRTRLQALEAAAESALGCLRQNWGSDPSGWTWGAVHRLAKRHFLSHRGALGRLLDHPETPVKGDVTVLCNAHVDPQGKALLGAGYKLVVDLAQQPAVLWAVDASAQSGHPGSPHYNDQEDAWQAGRYYAVPLDRAAVESQASSRQRLVP